MVLDARRGLEARGGVDRPRPHCADRGLDVVRAETAREHDPPLRRSRALKVARVLLLPGKVDHEGDRAAVALQHRVAPSHAAGLPLVQLDEIGFGRLRVADEDGDAQPVVRDIQHRVGPAWAALGEDEAEQVGAGLGGGVDVLLPCQAADLHERTGQELDELRGRIAGLHQRRADEDRVGAGELGRSSLSARMHATLGYDDGVAIRDARNEAELRLAVDLEGREVAGVDPDHLGLQRERPVELRGVVGLDEELEACSGGGREQ